MHDVLTTCGTASLTDTMDCNKGSSQDDRSLKLHEVITEGHTDHKRHMYTRESADDVYDCIKHTISSNIDVMLTETSIELETILSRVPYRKILENLFGDSETMTDNIPLVTRVYEESFMRECINKDEKPCAMGKNCECMFIDPNIQFIGIEFLLPGDSTSEQAQMCVLCHRKLTQQLFHDMVFKGENFRASIQRYGNICDQPNEYAKECMMICPPNANVHCMPLPIVAHQRNRYSVYIQNGFKCLRQHRVYFEDFRGDPPLPNGTATSLHFH